MYFMCSKQYFQEIRKSFMQPELSNHIKYLQCVKYAVDVALSKRFIVSQLQEKYRSQCFSKAVYEASEQVTEQMQEDLRRYIPSQGHWVCV